MLGTAFEDAGVLLVEQPGPWGHAGLRESHFDAPTASALERRAKAAGLRTLAIRRPGRTEPGASRHWAIARAGEPGCSWGSFERDEELLDVALDGTDGSADDAPVYLVCAHSKRDACCALRGRPLAGALDALRPGRVWECSHVGGHRFGANLLALPSGVLYGRVPAVAAPEVVAATERGDVIPGLLRGRIGLAPAEQAAVGFAHQQLDVAAVDAVTVLGSVDGTDATHHGGQLAESSALWTVRLAVRREEYVATVAVEHVEMDFVSCGKPAPKTELRVRPLTLVPA
jgi:hypothetical protein